MRKIINKIRQNHFIRVSGTNGIISLLKTVIAILANKVVAIYIGTGGIAMVGQLQSAINIITLISGGGFNQGITKYVAQYKEDEKTSSGFIATAFISTVVFSFLCGLLTLFFCRKISNKIFMSDAYFSIILVLAVTLVLYNLNNLFVSIINGYQLYRKYFKINLATTLISSVLSIVLVVLFKEYGALLSIVLSQSIVCVFTWYLVRKDHWVRFLSARLFSREKLRLLLKYTMITLVGAVIWPIVKIFIRSYVIENISLNEAGLWEATSKINDYIAVLATGSFSIYLLPKLSGIMDPSALRREIVGIYKVIVPFSILAFAGIYIFREYIILLLYSSDFMKVEHYLLLQMIGSFFWICKIVPMNFLLAKGKTNVYAFLEFSFCLLYVGLAYFLVPIYGVQGIQLSFAIYNLIYLLVNLILIRPHLISIKK